MGVTGKWIKALVGIKKSEKSESSVKEENVGIISFSQHFFFYLLIAPLLAEKVDIKHSFVISCSKSLLNCLFHAKKFYHMSGQSHKCSTDDSRVT